MKYEMVQDRLDTNSWRVEAIDYQNEGIGYIAIFAGPLAENRAKEYLDWKNKKILDSNRAA